MLWWCVVVVCCGGGDEMVGSSSVALHFVVVCCGGVDEMVGSSSVALHFVVGVLWWCAVVVSMRWSGRPRLPCTLWCLCRCPPPGWLADTPVEYAEAMAAALSSHSLNAITAAARKSVTRFSDEEFSAGFLRAMGPVVVPGVV